MLKRVNLVYLEVALSNIIIVSGKQSRPFSSPHELVETNREPKRESILDTYTIPSECISIYVSLHRVH